jgi:hypothetical protein
MKSSACMTSKQLRLPKNPTSRTGFGGLVLRSHGNSLQSRSHPEDFGGDGMSLSGGLE